MQAQFKLILTVILFTCANVSVIAQEDKQAEVKKIVEKTKDNKKNNETENNITVPLPVSVEQQYKEDLTHYLPSNHVTPILAGPDDYLTLINENMNVNSKGVAILLPDWQQGAVNPQSNKLFTNSATKTGLDYH